ncbi:putative ABC transport system ATP-binding protein [Halorubrum xinjiangense]|uniref:Putative ABC transport system ATP-binding protein n=1 Tax=Halorubrum xinjiangense TaxID=261291 RepID=A0A1G7J997_9EURY|nr:ABC transporter ATP-binding protein [Halorubrum xinjiangense]SDF21542.1 putative ABC transport system ATP-binding protein [Halorubrum xinjiangense]
MSGDAGLDAEPADAAVDDDGSPVDDAQSDAAAVALRGVVKRYPSGGGEPVVALDDVDFAVRPGEFVAVVGPSGSGKSTLLNVLGLLDDPTAGRRLLDGTDVTSLSVAERTRARKESIGFVFQDFHLLPTLTAVENVAMPTAFDPGDASDRAAALLGRFELGDRLDHEPSELSGGQKQRVAIARALINEPAVLLADEPTGNLDTETGEAILREFERVKAEGVAVVAVTHDPLVEEYADRVVDLTDGVLTGGLPADGGPAPGTAPERDDDRRIDRGDR